MSRQYKFWDRIAGMYDRNSLKYAEAYRETTQIMKNHLEAGQLVLDLGCGTGSIPLELASSTGRILAIDPSEGMIGVAKEKCRERGIGNVDFQTTEIMSPDLDRKVFDVILAANVLHFIPNCEQVLARIHSLLTPGGKFISVGDCLGDERTFGSRFQMFMTRMGIFPWCKAYTRKELEQCITDHGFRIRETKTLYPKPPNHLVVALKEG